MAINPASPHGPRPSGSEHLEANKAAEARRHEAVAAAKQKEQTEVKKDSADVSAEAKALADGAETRSKPSGLSADRLKEIGHRLATGHYDKPEVIDEVARRLQRDPNFRTGE